MSPGGLPIQRRGRVLRHTAAELHGAAAQQGRGGDGVEPGGMSGVFVGISWGFHGDYLAKMAISLGFYCPMLGESVIWWGLMGISRARTGMDWDFGAVLIGILLGFNGI